MEGWTNRRLRRGLPSLAISFLLAPISSPAACPPAALQLNASGLKVEWVTRDLTARARERLATEVIVRVLDSGRPVQGATVCFENENKGGPALLFRPPDDVRPFLDPELRGIRSAVMVTNAQGRAVLADARGNRFKGEFEIKATSYFQGKTASETIRGIIAPARMALWKKVLIGSGVAAAATLIPIIVINRPTASVSISPGTVGPPR